MPLNPAGKPQTEEPTSTQHSADSKHWEGGWGGGQQRRGGCGQRLFDYTCSFSLCTLMGSKGTAWRLRSPWACLSKNVPIDFSLRSFQPRAIIGETCYWFQYPSISTDKHSNKERKSLRRNVSEERKGCEEKKNQSRSSQNIPCSKETRLICAQTFLCSKDSNLRATF